MVYCFSGRVDVFVVVFALEEGGVQKNVAAGWVWWTACSARREFCRDVDDGVWGLSGSCATQQPVGMSW